MLKPDIWKNVLLFTVASILLAPAMYSGAIAEQSSDKRSNDNNVYDPESKFDSGFYDKVKQLDDQEKQKKQNEGSSYIPNYYDILIVVNQPPSIGKVDNGIDTVEKIKDKLSDELTTIHHASVVHKGEVLSFVSARLPITEILDVSKSQLVAQIGDGEEESGTASAQPQAINFASDQRGEAFHIQNSLSPITTDMDVARSEVNANNLAYTGAGVKVAVIDHGIRQDHPDLTIGSSGTIVGQANCSTGGCNTSPGADFADIENHGTPNAGIIAASGAHDSAHKGLATGAKLLNIKADTPGVVTGLDWAITQGAKVANISITTHTCNSGTGGLNTFDVLVDEAVEKGVVVVAAIGNSGDNHIIGWACTFNVITVGAIDDKNTTTKSDDIFWGSSVHGPTFDGRVKPDLLAPGVKIYTASSCNIGGSDYSDENHRLNGSCVPNVVAYVTGTSHAAPFVSAAAALLLEKNPTWTPAQIKAALKQAATSSLSNFPNLSTMPANYRGAGVLDVAGALAISTPDISTYGYGFDPSTYTAKSYVVKIGGVPEVQYNIVKESNLAYGVSATSGMLAQSETGTQKNIFQKLSFSQVKIDGSVQTLTDAKLFSAPRVQLGQTSANLFAVYQLQVGAGSANTVQVIEQYYFDSNDALPVIRFSSTGSHSYDVIGYSDYNVDTTADSARPTATGTAYSTETTTTNSDLYIRDTTTSLPYVYLVSTPTKWLLKWHDRTNNPTSFLNGESIAGQDIVIDWQKTLTGSGIQDLTTGGAVYWDGSVTAEAKDCDGNVITGMAVGLYNSGGQLVQSGFTPMYVHVATTGNYVLKFNNYGSNVFVKPDPLPPSAPVTSYTQYTAWGGDVNVSLDVNKDFEVDGVYATDGSSSCPSTDAGSIDVTSIRFDNSQIITGMYMQLTTLTDVQMNSGFTEVIFPELYPGSYKVYANDYCDGVSHQNYVFNSWSDGSTTRGKTVTVTGGTKTSIIARYTISTC